MQIWISILYMHLSAYYTSGNVGKLLNLNPQGEGKQKGKG